MPFGISTKTDKPHEHRLDSHVAYDGHILNVRVDEVRLPSGRASVREMVEHSGSVVVAPVTTERNVLLIRQYRYTVGETLIELPAGLIDPGERPDEAARRELHEETGYTAGELTFLGAAYVSPGYSREQSHFYVATGCTPQAHDPDQDEPIDMVPVPLGDLPGLLAPGQSPIHNAQALLALNWLVRVQDDLVGEG